MVVYKLGVTDQKNRCNVTNITGAFTTVLRLSKSKHQRKRFQNFRQSCVVCLLVKFQFHTNGHGSLLAINNFFSATKTLFNIFNWGRLNQHVVNLSKMTLHCRNIATEHHKNKRRKTFIFNEQ